MKPEPESRSSTIATAAITSTPPPSTIHFQEPDFAGATSATGGGGGGGRGATTGTCAVGRCGGATAPAGGLAWAGGRPCCVTPFACGPWGVGATAWTAPEGRTGCGMAAW